MTTSIAEPRPQHSYRPVLRRLIDILPTAAPITLQPPPATAGPVADPAASVLAERVVRAMVEMLDGRRPAHQLSSMLCPEAFAQLVALQEVTGRLRPRIHKVLIHPQSPGILEAVAVVTLSTGVRALAARFEKHGDNGEARWRCTALQLRLTAGDLATHRRYQPR